MEKLDRLRFRNTSQRHYGRERGWIFRVRNLSDAPPMAVIALPVIEAAPVRMRWSNKPRVCGGEVQTAT